MRRGPRRLEAVAAARGRLPCRVACCARRDAQRVSTLQSGATRAGAPHRCQFAQLNEFRLSGHGPVGPRLRSALSASQSGAGGTAGRADAAPPWRSRQSGGREPRRAAQRKPGRPGCASPQAEWGSGGGGGGLLQSPRPPFLPFLYPASNSPPPNDECKGSGGDRRVLETSFTVQEEEGPHIRPSPSHLPLPPAPTEAASALSPSTGWGRKRERFALAGRWGSSSTRLLSSPSGRQQLLQRPG